jgi:ABC-type sugar transport system ATPase subunit
MARAFGATNVIHGTLETGLLRTAIGVFRAPDGLGPGPVTICFRPQHVGLSAAGPGTRAVVTAMTPIGDSVEVTVRAGDVHLVARVPEPSAVGIGDDPHVVIDASQMLVFPRQATGALPLAAA